MYYTHMHTHTLTQDQEGGVPKLGHRTVWQFHPSPAKSSTSLAQEHDLMALKSSQGPARTQSLSGGGEQFWPEIPKDDDDADQPLSYVEFKNFVLRSVFDKYDPNESGYISAEELKAVARSHCSPQT